MDAATIILIVGAAIRFAHQLYLSSARILGKEKIPSWEDIISSNTELGDRIDKWVEKEGEV